VRYAKMWIPKHWGITPGPVISIIVGM